MLFSLQNRYESLSSPSSSLILSNVQRLHHVQIKLLAYKQIKLHVLINIIDNNISKNNNRKDEIIFNLVKITAALILWSEIEQIGINISFYCLAIL